MIIIRDSIAGNRVVFNYVENAKDACKAIDFVRDNRTLALDTESKGINPYARGWFLRTFQFGNDSESYILPASARRSIEKVLSFDTKWIGHNGPHDIRSLDVHLGYETGIVCVGETYLPAHHRDSRNIKEGGVNHGLKDQCEAFIDPHAGKWERALKAAFKEILIPIPGEVYKSGPRKGTQKYRKAKISEGYALIDGKHPAYIAYAGSDPVLTFLLWRYYQRTVREFIDLYHFDHKIQLACDHLQRRGILLDTSYTTKFKLALDSSAKRYAAKAAELGCKNIYSTQQLANALLALGANLTEYTKKGSLKVDDAVMRKQLQKGNKEVQELVQAVLAAKRRTKRKEAYADAMLRERDSNNRVHPSINSLGARTARMSVSSPALQQLPTKESESG